MKFKVSFPFMDDMGSIEPFIVSSTSMESKEENALWFLNSAREYDNLPQLTTLPQGTKFEKVEE